MDERVQWQEHTRRDHGPAKEEALRTESELQALCDSLSERLELENEVRQLREDVDLLIDIVTQFPKCLPLLPQLPEHLQQQLPSFAIYQPMPYQPIILGCSNLAPRLQQRYQQVQFRQSGRVAHNMGHGCTQAMPVGATTSGMMNTSIAAAGATRQPSSQADPDQQPHVSMGAAQGNSQVSTRLARGRGNVKGETNNPSTSVHRASSDPPGPAKRGYPLVLQVINQQRKVDALIKKGDTGQLGEEQAKLGQLQLLHTATATGRHMSNQDEPNTLPITTSMTTEIATASCKRKRDQGQSCKLAVESETPALSDASGAAGTSARA
jgi:hypothetical protein